MSTEIKTSILESYPDNYYIEQTCGDEIRVTIWTFPSVEEAQKALDSHMYDGIMWTGWTEYKVYA